MPMEQMIMTASTILSNKVGNSSEIDSLTSRVAQLTNAFDFWNRWMLVGLGFAAFAAIWIGLTTRLTIVRSKQLAVAQRELDGAKDANLQLDLKDKEGQIATLETNAGIRQERAAIAEKNLLELRDQVEPRRLTGSQKAELTKLLTGGGPNGVAIVTPIMDGEAADFADDFKSAVESANWQTARIVNRISSKFGIAVVTCEGTQGPVLLLAKRLSNALSEVGVAHELTTFKDGDASTSPAFQAGYLYLVVEHKPLPAAKPQ
jgi:hypothetical protein